MKSGRDGLRWTRHDRAGVLAARSQRRPWLVFALALLALGSAAAITGVRPEAGAASLPPLAPIGAIVSPAEVFAPQSQDGFIAYRDDATGLTFRHPQSWQVEEQEGTFRTTVIRGPEVGNFLKGVALVLNPSETLAPNQVLSLMLPELKGVAGAQQISRTDSTLANGTEARRLLYTFGQSPRQGMGLLLAAVDGDRAVIVNIMTSGGSLLESGGDVDRFLDSVQLGPASEEAPNPPAWGWTVYSRVTTGLGSDYVTGIAKDSQGRMWFSSWGGGLSMFDGNAWTRFGRPDFGPRDQRALALMVDSNDRLWIGTDASGVAVFDGRTWQNHDVETRALAHNRVRTIFEDSHGRVWAGTWGGGVSVFDGRGWHTYTTQNSGLTDDRVRAIMEDGEGRLWFGTWGGGISVLELAGAPGTAGQWSTRTPGDAGLPANRIATLYQDPEGNVWVGTFGAGLSRFDGTDWTTWTVANSNLPDDFILSIVWEADDKFRLGTRSNGVIAFKPELGAVAFAEPSTGLANGLSAPQVESLVYDGDGHLWAGSYGGGVLVWDGAELTTHTQASTGLLNDEVQHLAWDQQGRLWMATLGGVAVLDDSTWETYTTANSELASDLVVRLLIDDQGRTWAGTWGQGTWVFDGDQWERAPERGTLSTYVTSLVQDDEGNIWEASLEGFFLDRAVLRSYDGTTWTVHETTTGFFGSSAMLDLLVDANGWVWAGTLDRGVRVYDGSKWLSYSMQNSSMPSNRVLSVAEDEQGRIWAATAEGLSVFDGQVWTSYTAQNSRIPADLILAITPVPGGLLLSTVATGAVYFDGESWLAFSSQNSGLGANSVNGVFTDANGNLWFATEGGGVSRFGGLGLVLGLVSDEVRDWAAGPNRQVGNQVPPY